MTPEAKIVDDAVRAHWKVVQAWATGKGKHFPFFVSCSAGVVALQSDGETVTVRSFTAHTTIIALRPSG